MGIFLGLNTKTTMQSTGESSQKMKTKNFLIGDSTWKWTRAILVDCRSQKWADKLS